MTPEQLPTDALILGYGPSADLYLYNADIRVDTVDLARELCETTQQHQSSATLILCTNGGDPHAAFRLIRAFQRRYSTVRLVISGPCKSAGTLIALGADEIVFGPMGELGPLDVQMTKPNEIYRTSSGLDLPKALDILTDSAYKHIRHYTALLTLELNLAAPVAAEVATRLVTELFKPISAQIDPIRLGELYRATEIAERYARCLRKKNLKDAQIVQKLVKDYPSHGFVIDSEEAKLYFRKVEDLSGVELDIIKGLGNYALIPTQDRIVWNLTHLARYNASATSDDGVAHVAEQPDATI